jgi:hypothetical protein
MRSLAQFFMLAAVLTTIAACSATSDPEIPVINGVPVTGQALAR